MFATGSPDGGDDAKQPTLNVVSTADNWVGISMSHTQFVPPGANAR